MKTTPVDHKKCQILQDPGTQDPVGHPRGPGHQGLLPNRPAHVNQNLAENQPKPAYQDPLPNRPDPGNREPWKIKRILMTGLRSSIAPTW